MTKKKKSNDLFKVQKARGVEGEAATRENRKDEKNTRGQEDEKIIHLGIIYEKRVGAAGTQTGEGKCFTMTAKGSMRVTPVKVTVKFSLDVFITRDTHTSLLQCTGCMTISHIDCSTFSIFVPKVTLWRFPKIPNFPAHDICMHNHQHICILGGITGLIEE